ncbi:RDD family protein [Mycolicibacterium sp. P9-64]|uniref:RDD family protein n=1 Tax=Mycolicibacterium sp. P9-64 TaxID=2024612 RepID=UPI0011EF1D94|nr:RDD family protein [Mycolicibacterium sp. P9-64]KAA0074851.1 RDD family protein [Mycolicibacterium sp. P9-64]
MLEPATESPATDQESIRYASWPVRAGALAVDTLPAVAVIATMWLLALTTSQWSWLWWVYVVVVVLAFIATAVNRWLLPVLTGWSLGRAVFGIRVVTRSGAQAGIARLLLRDVAHLLDTVSLFVGWLWPLWDGRNRTFADLLLRTEARVVEPARGNVRRTAGIVFLVVALLCVGGNGLGYATVYRHDRAVEKTRTEIAEQGPRMVEQMLSYGSTTLKDDFARAQALATDGYRAQLISQQEAVQKAGATSNEYWAVSSAVLSASPKQAAMLVALQGQRGADAKSLKFITATVRVDFERAGDGHWRVANLTVLKKPMTNEPAK